MVENKDYFDFLGLDEKKAKEQAESNLEKASKRAAVTDGSGNGVQEGTEFYWPSQEVIDAGLCIDFATYNGNEYCRLIVEEVNENRLIAITLSKLNTLARPVDDNGKPTGKEDQPNGWYAEQWRSPGGRAKILERIQAVRDALNTAQKKRGNKHDHCKVDNARDVKVAPFPSDRAAGKAYSVITLVDFLAVDKDGNSVE